VCYNTLKPAIYFDNWKMAISQKSIELVGIRLPGFGCVSQSSIEHHTTDSTNPHFLTHFPEYNIADAQAFDEWFDSLRNYSEALNEQANENMEGGPVITIHSNAVMSLDDSGQYLEFDENKAKRMLNLCVYLPNVNFSFENMPYDHDVYTGSLYREEAYDPICFLNSMMRVFGGILPYNVGITFDTTHWMYANLMLERQNRVQNSLKNSNSMCDVIEELFKRGRLFVLHLSGYNGFMYKMFLSKNIVNKQIVRLFYEYAGIADYPKWLFLYKNLVPVNEIRKIVAQYGSSIPVVIETAPHWSLVDFVTDLYQSFRNYMDLRSQNSNWIEM